MHCRKNLFDDRSPDYRGIRRIFLPTELGIAYNDPDVGIKWPLPAEELVASERDSTAPLLREIADKLPFVYDV